MNAMVLNGLRRKLAMYQAAGLTAKAERTADQITWLEAEAAMDAEALLATPEPVGTIEQEQPQEPAEPEAPAPAGVDLTPAAQARADELGLTPDDFQGHEPSGKGGSFLVGDVERIAEAQDTSTETDSDGDE